MSTWHPGVLVTLFFFLGFLPLVMFVLQQGVSSRTDRLVGISAFVLAIIVYVTFGFIAASAFVAGMFFGYIAVVGSMAWFGYPTGEKTLTPPVSVSEAFYGDPVAEIAGRKSGHLTDPNEITFERTEEQLLLWCDRKVDIKV